MRIFMQHSSRIQHRLFPSALPPRRSTHWPRKEKPFSIHTAVMGVTGTPELAVASGPRSLTSPSNIDHLNSSRFYSLPLPK